MPEASILDLTTEITPTKLMRVDGQEYKLLNFDHLSAAEEAKVTATFARFQKVYQRLESAKNDAAAGVEAGKLRNYRVSLIEQMTDVPHDVVEKLGAAKQGKIITAIRDEIQAEVDSEDDDLDDGDGD